MVEILYMSKLHLDCYVKRMFGKYCIVWLLLIHFPHDICEFPVKPSQSILLMHYTREEWATHYRKEFSLCWWPHPEAIQASKDCLRYEPSRIKASLLSNHKSNEQILMSGNMGRHKPWPASLITSHMKLKSNRKLVYLHCSIVVNPYLAYLTRAWLWDHVNNSQCSQGYRNSLNFFAGNSNYKWKIIGEIAPRHYL